MTFSVNNEHLSSGSGYNIVSSGGSLLVAYTNLETASHIYNQWEVYSRFDQGFFGSYSVMFWRKMPYDYIYFNSFPFPTSYGTETSYVLYLSDVSSAIGTVNTSRFFNDSFSLTPSGNSADVVWSNFDEPVVGGRFVVNNRNWDGQNLYLCRIVNIATDAEYTQYRRIFITVEDSYPIWSVPAVEERAIPNSTTSAWSGYQHQCAYGETELQLELSIYTGLPISGVAPVFTVDRPIYLGAQINDSQFSMAGCVVRNQILSFGGVGYHEGTLWQDGDSLTINYSSTIRDFKWQKFSVSGSSINLIDSSTTESFQNVGYTWSGTFSENHPFGSNFGNNTYVILSPHNDAIPYIDADSGNTYFNVWSNTWIKNRYDFSGIDDLPPTNPTTSRVITGSYTGLDGIGFVTNNHFVNTPQVSYRILRYPGATQILSDVVYSVFSGEDYIWLVSYMIGKYLYYYRHDGYLTDSLFRYDTVTGSWEEIDTAPFAEVSVTSTTFNETNNGAWVDWGGGPYLAAFNRNLTNRSRAVVSLLTPASYGAPEGFGSFLQAVVPPFQTEIPPLRQHQRGDNVGIGVGRNNVGVGAAAGSQSIQGSLRQKGQTFLYDANGELVETKKDVLV